MYSEYCLSPIYQLEKSFYLPKYISFNEYENGNYQINNNITIIDNFESKNYVDDESRKKNEENEENKNSFIKLNFIKNQEEDNFNDAGFKIPTEKNQSKYMGRKKSVNLGNLNTKATSFTSKKTKRSNDSEKCENNEKVKCGRKTKDSLIKGNHNKHSEDNIMRKIKTNFFKYINEQLNSKLKNKNIQFLKLDSKISENLKRDYNISLMSQQIKNIYISSQISSKYRKQKTKNYDLNIKLIEEIYRELEEMDVINALELTYLDLFEEFRNNYLEQLLENIRDEEEKKKESEIDINEYLEKIKKLCLNYEEWFKNKKGRNRNKNNE